MAWDTQAAHVPFEQRMTREKIKIQPPKPIEARVREQRRRRQTASSTAHTHSRFVPLLPHDCNAIETTDASNKFEFFGCAAGAHHN